MLFIDSVVKQIKHGGIFSKLPYCKLIDGRTTEKHFESISLFNETMKFGGLPYISALYDFT